MSLTSSFRPVVPRTRSEKACATNVRSTACPLKIQAFSSNALANKKSKSIFGQKFSGALRSNLTSLSAIGKKTSFVTFTRESSIDDDEDEYDENEDDSEFDIWEDEEIYNFETGWSITDEDEEVVDEEEEAAEFVAGLRISQKLKRQLQREEKRKEREETHAPVSRGTHKKLRIIAGTAASRRLLSPSDANVRPMMEKVRGAVFSMLQSYCGSPSGIPEGTRWLDLFSGTGSVGLEALSRGCEEAQFVEADPWVISNVLDKNIQTCDAGSQSLVHTAYVEKFLQGTIDRPHAFKPFDFISVTPPYEKVSYTECMDLLARSPLFHEESFVIVEYPRKSRQEMPDELGSLYKIRDRKYGRTYVAIYGPLDELED